MKTCTLCERSGDDSYFEEHHLHPGRKRRKKVNRENDTITVCKVCGDQIHQMFTNQQLRSDLDSADALRQAMHTYIRWVQKKPLEDSVTMKRKKRRL